MPKTVLILGAGASKEAGLPTGEELMPQLAEMLDYLPRRHGRPGPGDTDLSASFPLAADAGKGVTESNLWSAASSISTGISQSMSIDNFIDMHRDNPGIQVCGKLAITFAILKAERSSLLERQGIDGIPALLRLSGTWYVEFSRRLLQGCTLAQLPERLQSVALIIFNYDRCLEHYLLFALKVAYPTLTRSEAWALVSQVEIYHPYGTVGELRWELPDGNPQRSAPRIAFGARAFEEQLPLLAKNIKTFTESTDPGDPTLIAMRNLVDQAERFIFLGFAYYEQNMDLIFGTDPLRRLTQRGTRTCYGTAYKIAPFNLKDVEERLYEYGFKKPLHLADEQCGEFVRNYSAAFRFK